MPLIIEPKQRLALRQSAIPRPMKQLVLKSSGLSHASKPSTDTILMTPAKTVSDINSKGANRFIQTQSTKNLEQDPEIPVLELVPFGKQPIVDFGRVTCDQTQVKHVCMRNITDLNQQLFVRSFPKPDKGFNIDATEFLIAPRNELFIVLTWTPKSLGSYRETITLQDCHRLPRRILVVGSAIRPKPELTQVKSSIGRRLNLPKISPKKLNLQEKQARIASKFAGTIKKPSYHSSQRPLTRLRCSPRLSGMRRQSTQVVKKMLSMRASIVIQSFWRMVRAKRQLAKLRAEKAAIIKIQSFWRMVVAKRALGQLKADREALLKVQSYFRMVTAQHVANKLRAKRDAVIKIQSYLRMIAAQHVLVELKARRDAIITIQSFCRMIVARRMKNNLKADREALLKVQSYCRMVAAQHVANKLRANRDAIIKIQSYLRMIQAKGRLAELRVERAVIIKLQSYWRMSLVKRAISKQKDAILKIQSFWRMIQGKRQLAKLRDERAALIKIQSFWRMLLIKRAIDEHKVAILKIQSYVRMILAKNLCKYLRARWGINVVERRTALIAAEQLQCKVMAACEGRAEAFMSAAESLCKHHRRPRIGRETEKKEREVIEL